MQFSDHRRDEDDDLWEGGIIGNDSADHADNDFDEKASTIKGLPPGTQSILKSFDINLSNLPANGKIHILGASATKDHGSDWDEDLILPANGHLLPNHGLRKKPSFASHISDEASDHYGSLKPSRTAGLPVPNQLLARLPKSSSFSARSPHSSAASLASRSEEDDELKGLEDDFDLPASLERVSLSPNTQRTSLNRGDRHSRNVSSASSASQPSRPPATFPDRAALANRPRPLTHSSSLASISDIDPEADFFDDLVLPTFLGGPSSTISSDKSKSKIDLQAILANKLQARVAAESDSFTHRRKHTEPLTETWEEGLVIEDGQDWAAKPSVVRTSSPLASRAKPVRRIRTIEQSDVTTPMSTRAGRSSSLNLNSVPPPSSTLNRSPSALRSSPLSAHARAARAQPRSSMSSIPSSTSGTLREAELSREAKSLSSKRPTSSLLAFLSNSSPSGNTPQRSLRYKKSTPHLRSIPSTSTAQPVPTLSRKHSLPSLSDANASSYVHDRSPTARTPSASGKTYALPTMASRARQQSYPLVSLPAIAGSPTTRDYPTSPSIPPARPSTPAGPGAAIRMTLPTRKRVVPSASDPTGRSSASLGTMAPTLQAAPPQVVRRPKRPRQYGDGTELDAFDDLPTNFEREKRFTARAMVRKASGPTIEQIKRPSQLVKAPAPVKVVEPSMRRKIEPKTKPHLIRNLNASATSRGESLLHLLMSDAEKASISRGSNDLESNCYAMGGQRI